MNSKPVVKSKININMLRALVFFFVVIVATTIGALIVILVGFFSKYSEFLNRIVIRPWAKTLLWTAGVKVDLSGLENIKPNQPYIVVSNHQSHMDIPVLMAHLPLKLTIIAKKELFKIPIFGHGMRAFGILEIDRTNRAKAIETLNQAAAILKDEKVSILTFPEGTRSTDGQLRSFKKGPFMLAINTKIPIVPISIKGTFPILPKGQLKVRPGRVQMTIHPPVETDTYDINTRNELIDHVHQIIAEKFYETA